MHPSVFGLILAGGRSQRMGGVDKALSLLGGLSLLDHVRKKLAPQCAGLLLSSNADTARGIEALLPVVSDSLPDFAGPLAGVLAGLDHLAVHGGAKTWMVSVPVDTPFLPEDLVARLVDARAAEDAAIAMAASGGRIHPVITLWPLRLRHDLRQAMREDKIRRVDRFTARYRASVVEWPVDPLDPFFNINEPKDLVLAEAMLKQKGLQH